MKAFLVGLGAMLLMPLWIVPAFIFALYCIGEGLLELMAIRRGRR